MKQQILDTSLKQFLKYGIREMSIQKLVEPLGISTKTVYKYFTNKQELLEEALHLYYAQQYQQLENLKAAQNPVHLLFDIWFIAIEVAWKVNVIFFQDLHYYYPQLEEKIERMIAKKFSDQFIQIIKKGMQEGVFEKSIYPEVVMGGIYILYNAIVKSGQFKDFQLSSYDVLANTIAISVRGICTPSGVQEFDLHRQQIEAGEGVKIFQEKLTPA